MKLATIETISEIRPIEGADFILAAKIQGYWSVIAKKDGYKVSDKVIFVQPDSLIPRQEYNRFLWPKNDQDPSGKPIRLQVKKMKKQVSQGLVLPVMLVDKEVKEGDDVTVDLGITHYTKPIPACLAGKIKGQFPNFLRKTDEERLMSYPECLTELKDKDVYISVKADGSSGSFYYNKGEFGVCSRNLDLLEEASNSFWKVARQLDLESKLKQFGFNCAIQGELVGQGIQDNHLGINGLDLVCFNIFDIDAQKYLDYKEMSDLCNSFIIPKVKVIYKGTFNFTLDELQKLANDTNYDNGNCAEGLVIRPVTESYSETLGGRLSVKVISEKYALKYGE